MSIVRNRLREYRLTGDSVEFLRNAREKLLAISPAENGSQSCRIDELYGFMPPLDMVRHTPATGNEEIRKTIRFYQLDGILTLQTRWDELTLGIWEIQSEYYCSYLKVFKEHHKLLLAPQWNPEAYETMFQLAVLYLELLAAGFRSPLLRIPAIRNDLHHTLERIDDPLFRNCSLEIFIRLLDQELPAEEMPDQELFLQRARIQLADVLARRAGLAAKAGYRSIHARAAIRGAEEAWNRLFHPINRIWGHLANLPYYRRKIREYPSRSFAFDEIFHPDGRVSLSEVYPVEPDTVSDMAVKLRCDRYREVFPDCEAAAANRKIATELIRKLYGGRK